MLLNGKFIELPAQVSLSSFLTAQGYDLTRVAAEVSGNVIPRKDFDTVIVTDSDTVEVVTFVGGG
ncbi:MAG: sulfur carrier protein ThiS [Oscillospiraceae bacterium]|jgi:thiamine biosynthesis protein ThiS|nr:sulfur carrier protein ThiS [Oscillospiraceae bacterium]